MSALHRTLVLAFIAGCSAVGCLASTEVRGASAELSDDQSAPLAGAVCDTASEGADVELSCPAGEVITAIQFASYGRPRGVCGGYAATCVQRADVEGRRGGRVRRKGELYRAGEQSRPSPAIRAGGPRSGSTCRRRAAPRRRAAAREARRSGTGGAGGSTSGTGGAGGSTSGTGRRGRLDERHRRRGRLDERHRRRGRRGRRDERHGRLDGR